MIIGGVFSFFNFRSIAKAHAIDEARKIAEATADRVTNEYLQRELLIIIEEYREMLDSGGGSDDDADQIANAQDDAVEGEAK